MYRFYACENMNEKILNNRSKMVPYCFSTNGSISKNYKKKHNDVIHVLSLLFKHDNYFK